MMETRNSRHPVVIFGPFNDDTVRAWIIFLRVSTSDNFAKRTPFTIKHKEEFLMAVTLAEWFFIGCLLVGGIAIAVILRHLTDEWWPFVVAIVVALALCVGCVFFANWYNTSTADGQRSYKDFQSNLSGGLYREITITAEDGREIFHYEGRCDIETTHKGNGNYILFEGEDGLRYMIYYGIQDTILIIEKGQPEE